MVSEGAVSPEVEAGAVFSIYPSVKLLLVGRELHRGKEIVLPKGEGGKYVHGPPVGPSAPVVQFLDNNDPPFPPGVPLRLFDHKSFRGDAPFFHRDPSESVGVEKNCEVVSGVRVKVIEELIA